MTVPRFHTLGDVLRSAERLGEDRTAIRCGPERVSHAELAARTRLVASRLSRRGVGRGSRVAIVLPKSIEAVVAMTATLRAGAAYVPIEANQPDTRIQRIIADCDPSLVITEHDALLSPEPRGEGAVLDDHRVDPTDVAFILYTSGSTGTPKGVQITHRNLLAFLHWALDELGLCGTDVLANTASFNFDLSTLDLFGALAVGATVRLFREDELLQPFVLAQTIASDRITVWYSVPRLLRLMLAARALDGAALSTLRLVLFAGEPFPVRDLRELRRRLPAPALYNLYGPTETNACTAHRVVDADLADDAGVPIGRPLPEVDVRIVDADGRDVRGGEQGELLVSGSHVTPGYFGLTGHRNEDNHRRGIHATGDVVSRRADGALLFHGRIDDMVKVAGFRVELGEVERALATHPAIEAVAVVADAATGDVMLRAFYVSATELALLDVKRHCADRLPVYMIPHRIHRVADLPATPNGKVDRKLLLRNLAAPTKARS